MFKKLSIASALLIGLALSSTAAMTADEYNVSREITAAGAPLGLHGVDPVEFIATANPVEGSAAHTAVHDGVAHYFSTEDNMKAFEADPAAYLPKTVVTARSACRFARSSTATLSTTLLSMAPSMSS